MPSTKTAVILVAGIGSRLRPLTEDRPKALVEVRGETILGRALRTLADHGVQKAILATGYREDAVRRACVGAPLMVSYCHNAAFDTTQNSVSLALCREAVGQESFFKLDGDIVFSPAILNRLEQAAADLVVGVDRKRILDAEAMKVQCEGDRIVRFGKGLAPEVCMGESIGIERIESTAVRRLFDALGAEGRAGRTDLYYEDVYSTLVRSGLTARAVDVSDLPWSEIDTMDDLKTAAALLG